MQAVNPGLISSILRCAKNPDIPLSKQKAAIQALRWMDINDEVHEEATLHWFTHFNPSLFRTIKQAKS